MSLVTWQTWKLILDIAKKFKLQVVEDATEALGSYYTSGKFAGKHAGTLGDFGAYSFNGNKIITTGGGGMIVGKDDDKFRTYPIYFYSSEG